MNIITRFIEKLIYRNKKVIINVDEGENSRIVVFNLSPYNQIALATLTVSLIVNEYNKRNNTSYKDKVEIVKRIVEGICEHVKVDIKIDTSVQ